MIADIPPVRESETKKDKGTKISKYVERNEINVCEEFFHEGAMRIVTTCVYDKREE